MRGRKPKPTKLKLVAGKPGHRPINENEPDPATAVPACPEHLSDDARAEWERIAPELEELGLLSEIDRAALAAYCQAWGRWVDAERNLRQFGVIVKSPSGYPIQSPFLAIANKALAQMRDFLTEFGMTPSSRARVSVRHRGPDSDIEDWFSHG